MIRPAGFEDEHACGRVLGQTRRERAAGRAATHDDVVADSQASTTVCNSVKASIGAEPVITYYESSVKASIGAEPPTRPMPLALPDRPPNGRCVSQ